MCLYLHLMKLWGLEDHWPFGLNKVKWRTGAYQHVLYCQTEWKETSASAALKLHPEKSDHRPNVPMSHPNNSDACVTDLTCVFVWHSSNSLGLHGSPPIWPKHKYVMKSLKHTWEQTRWQRTREVVEGQQDEFLSPFICVCARHSEDGGWMRSN